MSRVPLPVLALRALQHAPGTTTLAGKWAENSSSMPGGWTEAVRVKSRFRLYTESNAPVEAGALPGKSAAGDLGGVAAPIVNLHRRGVAALTWISVDVVSYRCARENCVRRDSQPAHSFRSLSLRPFRFDCHCCGRLRCLLRRNAKNCSPGYWRSRA